ncbi:Carboxylic ester hydrolase [Aphelenchoides bicaudatus]|nr:Carboxylic ester hydrolase [Aphelenchoides bicaudatus]
MSSAPCLFLCLLGFVAYTNAETLKMEPVVQLKQGTLEGFRFRYPDESGRFANIYLGVPYAKPPVDDLRFERPQPLDESDSRIATKKFAPGCMAVSAPIKLPPNSNVTVGPPQSSEDCLYLNVMAPSEKSPFPTGYPVLLFIHGGGFSGGSSEMYGFQAIAHEFAGQAIVMVTIQYRLGLFGFFSNGDSTAPGNLGLWDQKQALEWIRDNIAAFGGNPKHVTLWGQNSGAASVGALSISPKTRDLFHQSIEMSGSVMAGWANSNRVVDESMQVAKKVGCALKTPSLVKECMKAKPVEELTDAMQETGWRRDAINFARFQPRWDNDFFNKPVDELIRESPKKPTIQGITSQEAMLTTLPFSGAPRQIKFIETEIARPEFFGAKTEEARQKLIQFYADRNATLAKTIDPHFYLTRYTQILSDTQFAIPSLMEVRKKSEEGWPVYLYLSNYMNPRIKLPVLGTYSTYEFPYLFGLSVVGPFEFDPEDRKLQSLIVSSFANFVHSGNPSTMRAIWPAVTAEHPLGFFDMRPDPVLRDNLMLDRLQFWEQMAHDFDYDLIRDVDKRTEQPKDFAQKL